MDESTALLPLDPELLIFLKFFVVFTCIFFWIRLAYIWLFGRYEAYRHSPRHKNRYRT